MNREQLTLKEIIARKFAQRYTADELCFLLTLNRSRGTRNIEEAVSMALSIKQRN